MTLPKFTLDHLAIRAKTLEEGAAFVQQALGIDMPKGGRHTAMGTHNLLLSLGDDLYMEVIAIDPNASVPKCPRWFDLDSFEGRPELSTWIVACNDIDTAIEESMEQSRQAKARCGVRNT